VDDRRRDEYLAAGSGSSARAWAGQHHGVADQRRAPWPSGPAIHHSCPWARSHYGHRRGLRHLPHHSATAWPALFRLPGPAWRCGGSTSTAARRLGPGDRVYDDKWEARAHRVHLTAHPDVGPGIIVAAVGDELTIASTGAGHFYRPAPYRHGPRWDRRVPERQVLFKLAIFVTCGRPDRRGSSCRSWVPVGLVVPPLVLSIAGRDTWPHRGVDTRGAGTARRPPPPPVS